MELEFDATLTGFEIGEIELIHDAGDSPDPVSQDAATMH